MLGARRKHMGVGGLPILNPMVGVAPGTTTMQISGGGGNLGCACYPSASGVAGLGVCPPGYYGQDIMMPGMPLPTSPQPDASTPAVHRVMPYTDLPNLKGLGSPLRWDLIGLAVALGFAGTLGYMAYGARKKRRAQ